jgi:hypothetical protein
VEAIRITGWASNWPMGSTVRVVAVTAADDVYRTEADFDFEHESPTMTFEVISLSDAEQLIEAGVAEEVVKTPHEFERELNAWLS